MAKSNKKNSTKLKVDGLPKKSSKNKENLFIAVFLFVSILASVFAIIWIKGFKVQSVSITSEEDKRDRFKSYETNLKFHEPEIRDQILKVYTDKKAAEEIGKSSNLAELVYNINKVLDPNYSLKTINDFLNSCANEIKSSGWGTDRKHFDKLLIKEKLEAIASYLIRDKNFVYGSSILDFDVTVKGKDGKDKTLDKKKGDNDPEPYTIDSVVKNGIGNCATLPVVYAMLAQRLGLSVKLVGIKDHMFARYDDGQTKINIETTSPEGMGVGTPDIFYIDLLKPSRRMLLNSTCMKSMDLRESASALFVTQMAYIHKSKGSKSDLKRAIAYSLYFNEKSEHAAMNSLSEFTNKNSTEDSLRIVLEVKAQWLGALPPDPTEHEKLTSEISSVGFEVKKLSKKLRDLDVQRINKFMNQGRFNSNDVVQQQQKKITLVSNLRSDITRNRRELERLLKENQNKLSFEQSQMLNQIIHLNGQNWAEMLRYQKAL